jgi:hypothetical protein
MITADLLRAAGVTVTGVDIDELDPALTAGPRRGRDTPQATTRIEFTAAGTGEPRQLPVRIGYALAMATTTGAPIRVADQLMDQLAVPAQSDLVGQFTRDVPLPRRRRGLSRLVRRGPTGFASRLADDRRTAARATAARCRGTPARLQRPWDQGGQMPNG